MEGTLAYDELTGTRQLDRQTARLRRPEGRRRDASVVGMYNDALRHKDGALTAAYHVDLPATMFADDALVDTRYDDLARMLAFEKPSGTMVQFRYSTFPDPGCAIIELICTRASEGTHLPAALLQASNLAYLQQTAESLPYRRSILTMWVRVPPKRRTNSTLSALADFKQAIGKQLKTEADI